MREHFCQIRWVLALLATAGSAFFCLAPAEANTPEVQVKAAYLYNFTSFVRWPAPPLGENSFRLCIAGRSDIANVLQQLVRGQTIAGQSIEVLGIEASQRDRVASCHLLYLGRGVDTARTLRSASLGMPVLTVCDRSAGTRGCVIDFLVIDGRVRFAIDRDLAISQRLEVSSKLFDVAIAVPR